MNALSLIKAIRGATFKFESQRYTKLALVDTLKKLFSSSKQEIWMTKHPGLISKALKQANPNLTPENVIPT
eukprot:8304599-Ditylum_brightwellii.AAC.2